MKSHPGTGIAYSPDGYVRLTFGQLSALTFASRYTFRDESLRRELVHLDITAIDAGYCDWLDNSTPVQITIGWAWFVGTKPGRPSMAPGGTSSNVMLVTNEGIDLGPKKTDEILTAWLEAGFWHTDEYAARAVLPSLN